MIILQSVSVAVYVFHYNTFYIYGKFNFMIIHSKIEMKYKNIWSYLYLSPNDMTIKWLTVFDTRGSLYKGIPSPVERYLKLR